MPADQIRRSCQRAAKLSLPRSVSGTTAWYVSRSGAGTRVAPVARARRNRSVSSPVRATIGRGRPSSSSDKGVARFHVGRGGNHALGVGVGRGAVQLLGMREGGALDDGARVGARELQGPREPSGRRNAVVVSECDHRRAGHSPARVSVRPRRRRAGLLSHHPQHPCSSERVELQLPVGLRGRRSRGRRSPPSVCGRGTGVRGRRAASATAAGGRGTVRLPRCPGSPRADIATRRYGWAGRSGKRFGAPRRRSRVVVATRERSARIAALVESLRRQTIPAGDFGVMVVDDAGRDGSFEVLARAAPRRRGLALAAPVAARRAGSRTQRRLARGQGSAGRVHRR